MFRIELIHSSFYISRPEYIRFSAE